MIIKVKYFAGLRDKAGISEEELKVSPSENLAGIYETLSLRYGFPLRAREIKFAVNNEYVDEGHQLLENDVLVFIPPVAGG